MKVRDGGHLAQARRRAGFTQYDLAALCQCTQAAVSGLETGTMPRCSVDLATLLAKWLRCDVDDLFEREDASRQRRVTNAAGTRRSRADGLGGPTQTPGVARRPGAR